MFHTYTYMLNRPHLKMLLTVNITCFEENPDARESLPIITPRELAWEARCSHRSGRYHIPWTSVSLVDADMCLRYHGYANALLITVNVERISSLTNKRQFSSMSKIPGECICSHARSSRLPSFTRYQYLSCQEHNGLQCNTS